MERAPLPAIRLKRLTIWRDARGRFSGPGRRGARRVSYLAQVDARGRVLDVVERLTRHEVIKTVLPPGVESQRAPGMLFDAMARTNMLSKSKGAKRVEIAVSYVTPEGRRESFKLSHVTVDEAGNPMPRATINSLMIGSIVEALRQRGYRTRYALSAVDWSQVKDRWRRTETGVRYNTTSKTQVGRRGQVDHVRIKVTMER